MNEQATQYREEIKAIFRQMRKGEIEHYEGKKLVEAVLVKLNKLNKEKSIEVANRMNAESRAKLLERFSEEEVEKMMKNGLAVEPRHRDQKFSVLYRSPELLW